MKKLAIISTHPIQYQIPLFKKLKKKGIKPIVFFASKHGLNKQKKDPEFLQKIKWDIGVNPLSGYKSYFSKNQKFNINQFRLSYKNLEEDLKKENVKYILILGWNNFHYLKSIYYAIKNKIKIILRVETNLYSTKNYFKKLVKYFFLTNIFKFISFFLFIGKLNKQFYVYHKVSYKKLYDAPYFVDNSFFKKKTSKQKIKKKIKINAEKIILFVGKLIDRKNPIEFLKLASKYKDRKDLKFLMIGDGVLKNKCKKFIIKNNLSNVLFKGFINQNQLRNYYWASDLLIVPSIYETWGLNMNEAFASCTPVICTKYCGGSYDLIEDGKTGYRYDLGNIGNLKKKVDLIINNKKFYTFILANIKKKIKHYDLDITIKSLNRIINE